MNADRTILSLDIGTTAVKVGLFSTGGELLHSASREEQLSFPAPGRVEQAPLETRKLIVEAVREIVGMVDTQTVAAISLSNHRGTALALNASGEPVSPFVVWMDKRTIPQCDVISDNRRCKTGSNNDSLTYLFHGLSLSIGTRQLSRRGQSRQAPWLQLHPFAGFGNQKLMSPPTCLCA